MKKSRLLSEMRATARGLERVGVLGKQTLREFDALDRVRRTAVGRPQR